MSTTTMTDNEYIENLVTALKNGVVTLKFRKVNGDIRIMKCTMSPSLIPNFKESVSGRKTPLNSVSVWDLEKKDWRAFRTDSVIGYSHSK